MLVRYSGKTNFKYYICIFKLLCYENNLRSVSIFFSFSLLLLFVLEENTALNTKYFVEYLVHFSNIAKFVLTAPNLISISGSQVFLLGIHAPEVFSIVSTKLTLFTLHTLLNSSCWYLLSL